MFPIVIFTGKLSAELSMQATKVFESDPANYFWKLRLWGPVAVQCPVPSEEPSSSGQVPVSPTVIFGTNCHSCQSTLGRC